MALYSTAFLGSAPIGSLIAGALASRIGTQWTIAACGAGCIATGAWIAHALPEIRRLVRPIYMEHGIIPANEVPASVARYPAARATAVPASRIPLRSAIGTAGTAGCLP